MTAAGKAHRLPWRVSWYMRDATTGKPVGGGRRAFGLEASAVKHAEAQRALGYCTEVWSEQQLPGISAVQPPASS